MLKLNKITKSYRTKDYVQNALDEVSIAFRENEFASILGASGSGKTTMLNIIGGLDKYDSGDLLIDGVSTKKYKSSNWDTYRNNRVGFVFQSFNLIPHQTVLSNVELALTLSGVSSKERKARAVEALDEVGLIDHIHKLPTQLSGGQMQRVAIARALINDPEIVLADEPTGSLDSSTSEQVMDLLEGIAKDRLVIMVTHNPELAHKYTNRIIELKDGQVIGDTNPYIIDSDKKIISKAASKKTKMSFLTAISLSVSNLMTKKGRTFITAVAGSIGIIGIAAILALASGINLYIDGIEQETMSAYPLSVDSSGIDITSFIGGEGSDFAPLNRDEVKENEIPVINTITSVFSLQNKNDLKSFKAYIESNHNKIDPYVKNVQYKYGITPEIYLENEKPGLRQVNPDNIFSKFGFGSPAGLDMISGAGDFGMKNFSELPGDANLFEDQYDVVVGKWPESINEVVVVLMDSGSLTDTTMYTLGLKDRKALENMFEKFVNEEDFEIEENKDEKIIFEEILAVKFKLVNPAEKYAYDSLYDLWIDKSDDVKHMDTIIAAGMDLNVVGIVKANPDTKTPMLSSGIYYPYELTTHLIEQAATYEIVKKQIDSPEVNIFTGQRFDDETELAPNELFKLDDFISIDETMIQNSFNIDMSALNIDFSDFEINIDQLILPSLDLETLALSIATQINVPIEEIQIILTNVLQDFVDTQEQQGINPSEEWIVNFDEYIRSEAVQNSLIQQFENLNTETQIAQKLTEIVQNYFSSYIKLAFDQIMETVQQDFTRQIEAKIGDLATNLQNAFTIDTNALAQAFKFNLDEEEFFNLIRSLGERGQISQSSNLTTLGYRDINDPTQINLFPKDFTTKENVIDFIDNYNTEMQNTDQEVKVVKYTDFVGAIMSSVTTIINTISYALIAFVAISLVVSSIMIGVITYVSVLERIKEIGILRAIGASKKDIRRVFNAETLLVGFIAGTFGILVTYVISFIANIIVYNTFAIPNIAHLESKAALVLILISMFLAFISGLIPASTAANKNPVEALRSE
ncbi:MAG: ABC transporter ATP-binding protein/permease [Erysipelothrix sp.]|nr:ABC transporter ATP-binding protein/permease [Erysipelothrix sp.]